MTEQITMLIYCRTKTFNKACSWRQVRRLNFTGVLIVFYFRQPTSLGSAVSPSACGQSHSASPPAERHFVVETRLTMIHVCTSNENAYQERRVSCFVRRGFRRLKIGSGTHEKEQRYAQDPRIHL